MKNLFLPYELAVIFKEKGFSKHCLGIYDNGVLCIEFSYEANTEFVLNNEQFTLSPTYQQAVSWLIENHEIHPCYGSNHSGWYCGLTKTNGTTIKDQDDYNYFKTHYEALNKAIKEALKLI